MAVKNKIGKLKEKHQEDVDFELELNPSIDDYIELNVKDIKSIKGFLKKLTKYLVEK